MLREGLGSDCSWDGVSFWGDGMFWNWTVVPAAPCECAKRHFIIHFNVEIPTLCVCHHDTENTLGGVSKASPAWQDTQGQPPSRASGLMVTVNSDRAPEPSRC